MVSVESKLGDVFAFHPRDSVGGFQAAFINRVKDPEVVAEAQVVDDVEIRLAGGSGKVVMAAGVLYKHGVDQIRLEHRVQRAHQRLVADEKIARPARGTD